VGQSAAMAEAAEAAPGERSAARRPRLGEAAVRVFLLACAVFVVLTTIAMLAFLGQTGLRGAWDVGFWSLLTGDVWKPEAGLFGGLALIVGTFASATGAVFLGAVPAVLAAVWLTEFSPSAVRRGYRRVMEIAAAIPSVVYGWLALVYLVPILAGVAHALHGEDAPVTGEGLASSALLLAIMIGPTVLLLALDALSRVPPPLRDASAAVGASPWQTAFRVSLPYAWRSVLVAVFFGFARAAGETMAVQMVIGGARRLPTDFLFSPTTTISAQIVMDMQEARPGTRESDVLYSMALVLLMVSITVVLVTRALSRKEIR
jgi:phosphate transport system permease protein